MRKKEERGKRKGESRMKKEERGKEKEERRKKEERGNATDVPHLRCGRSSGGARDTREPAFARGVRVARSRESEN